MTANGTRLQKILGGFPEILPENEQSRETRELIQREVLRGIEWIQGAECRRQVEQAGLTQMHLYFPKKKLPLLVTYLNYRTGKRVLQTFKDFCRRMFSLEGNFYIEAILVYRIHFPYGCAEVSSPAKPGLGGLLKAAYYIPVLKLPNRFPRIASWFPGYHWPTFKKPYEDGHAPHRDYWFGYALDAINLWWGIEKVTEENGMMLFPETFGKKLRYRTQGEPYIAEGERMTKPRYTPLKAGEVLALNTNELHATRLNESPFTRVVVSVRVSPEKPKFYSMPDNTAHVSERVYHETVDLDRGNFVRLWNPAKDPRHQMWAEPVETKSPSSAPPVVKINESWPLSKRVSLFDSKVLEEKGRVLVQLINRELVVFSTPKGPMALSSKCPHEGYPLADGFLEEGMLVCPGHGMKLSLANGRASCGLQTKCCVCTQSDGVVFLEPQV